MKVIAASATISDATYHITVKVPFRWVRVKVHPLRQKVTEDADSCVLYLTESDQRC